MNHRVLVVDTNYHPISIVNWKKSLVLMFTGRAVKLQSSTNSVRSVNGHFYLPEIIKITSEFKFKPKEIPFTKGNLLIRDNFECQYCPNKEKLTYDHVNPVSLGGTTEWDNIVICCESCNFKKANRTPKQAGMKLKKEPKKPKWELKYSIRQTELDPESWQDYLW